ncbi:MAG TPA: M20/M25/M40 family metallo-hydrolase [Candidatus Limnocylindrales bacterium]|nr:M20/M25/M40 family metallo-hydrolase [Candidatus Limnocylindrales bacterium]
MKNRLLVLAAVLLAVNCTFAKELSTSKSAEADTTKSSLVKIAGNGAMESHAFEYLTELSDDIGARVTGSSQDRKGIEWSLAKMKSIGLENVRAEKYSVWKGWTRGMAEASILAPTPRKLTVAAMGWTGSTSAGGVDADLATANVFDLEHDIKNAKAYRGKVVFLWGQGTPKGSIGTIFGQIGEFLRAANREGALAVLTGDYGFRPEGLGLVHTGILGFAADFAVPFGELPREDQGQIERYLLAGKTVRVHVNIQNKFTDGPVESANVVGEIVGREHPEEVVVVGGHLDSWDLSEGATDNGVGVAAALAAADAILKSSVRPRRTIRFVLFTGEEEGLLGSLAYVKQHSAEIKNHLAAVILDNGQGPVREFQLGGRGDLLDSFEPFAASLRNIREIKVSDKIELETDTASFILVGLPGINLDQDSPEYKYTHHSAADALEAVKPDVLAQDAIVMALTGYWIADRLERFALPWPRERTARVLRETGQFDMLNAIGLWTFGDLGQSPQ